MEDSTLEMSVTEGSFLQNSAHLSTSEGGEDLVGEELVGEQLVGEELVGEQLVGDQLVREQLVLPSSVPVPVQSSTPHKQKCSRRCRDCNFTTCNSSTMTRHRRREHMGK